MRDLKDVIYQIIDMIPENFEDRDNVITRLNCVIEDISCRDNSFMVISWVDTRIILLEVFSKYLKESEEWTWIDDIFELFSGGKWSKQFNYKKKVGCLV